jgi:hypothetical protein
VAPPWVVSPDQRGPDSRVDTTAARAPQRGGLSMGGGSPYGYRRWVREIPSLVIAMRESNAPSPPVSQSAAITPSAKEQPLTECTADSRVCNTGCLPPSRGIVVGWWMLAGRDRTIRGGTKLRRRQRWGAKRAGQATPQSVPDDPGRHPPCDGTSPLTRKTRRAHRGSATQRHHGCWTLCLANTSASPSSPPHLEWGPIKNYLWPGRALRLCLPAVTWLRRASGAYLSRRADALEGENPRC